MIHVVSLEENAYHSCTHCRGGIRQWQRHQWPHNTSPLVWLYPHPAPSSLLTPTTTSPTHLQLPPPIITLLVNDYFFHNKYKSMTQIIINKFYSYIMFNETTYSCITRFMRVVFEKVLKFLHMVAAYVLSKLVLKDGVQIHRDVCLT